MARPARSRPTAVGTMAMASDHRPEPRCPPLDEHRDRRLAELTAKATELQQEYADLVCADLQLRARDSLYVFGTEVLGYTDLLGPPETNPAQAVCDWVQATAGEFRMVLLPRDSFKSTICTITYPLWRLWQDPDYRILILMENYSKACDKLREIKGHLDGSNARSRFLAVVGDWVSKARQARWRDDQIDIAPRTKGYAEASITAMGVEGSPTGKHFNLIIPDDPCSENNSRTPEMIAFVKQKLHALYPCLDSKVREMLVVGTRWDDGDAYGEILDQLTEQIETPWAGGWRWDPKSGWHRPAA